jgi:hypothetical protein
MRKQTLLIVWAAGLIWTLSAVASAPAQESRSLRFDKTVPFQIGQLIPLQAAVGPVKVAKVQLTRGSGGGSVKDTIVGRISGATGGDPETQATIRASFDVENPDEEEWVVTFTLDFLDRDGKLIDRAVKSHGFEGEAKVFQLDHATLAYVVPMIHSVRIRLEARYD